MSFDLDFDEVPLIFAGVPIAPVSGRASISSSGRVSELMIENPWEPKGRRLYLTGMSADAYKNNLFQIIALSVEATCFERIQFALADYRRDNVASYHDWKRKNAAEMAS